MLPTYVLITAARNEAQYIESTIDSVLAQTVRPQRWIIVSDGSTDGTDTIVRNYAANHDWIELLCMPERADRNIAGKVLALNAGQAVVADIRYQVIAFLDADISFDRDYFCFLLAKLSSDPQLGLVGTPYREISGEVYNYRYVSLEHVSGACQVFRRSCYEAIGGYLPLKGGAIDSIAAVTARMQGWNTRTFTEKTSTHLRPMGTAESGTLQARFMMGARDYAIGNHPMWEALRCMHQMRKRPYLLRGMALATGYIRAFLHHARRPVSREFVRFYQREQLHRLRAFIVRSN